MSLKVLNLLVYCVLLWIMAGLWEWPIPERIRAGILAWQEKFIKDSSTLLYALEAGISFNSEERKLMNIRRSLPRLIKHQETPLYVEITIYYAGEDDPRYAHCLSQRFPEFGLSFRKSGD